MKAVRLVQPGHALELHDMPLPRVDDDDVLVRVKAAGICHSDVHYRAGKSRVHPLLLRSVTKSRVSWKPSAGM
jgi:D-arabinose 1-dehydrogenase-like Zn-dependent alcohol dehydrogenase